MKDTRGSGKEYLRHELSSFKKIHDLYTNDNRLIYAELLVNDMNQFIYLREWLASNDPDNSFNFCIINSISELKEELKKDVDHGDLAPGKLNKICEEILSKEIFK